MEKKEMTGFQGIFLDEISKKRLIDLQERKLKYIVEDMHITFKFGKTEMTQAASKNTATVKAEEKKRCLKNSGVLNCPEKNIQ